MASVESVNYLSPTISSYHDCSSAFFFWFSEDFHKITPGFTTTQSDQCRLSLIGMKMNFFSNREIIIFFVLSNSALPAGLPYPTL